jgi:hypothetical protein
VPALLTACCQVAEHVEQFRVGHSGGEQEALRRRTTHGPKAGGLLVGLDTFAHVAQNCWDSLTSDEEREVFKLPSFMAAMFAT